MTKPALLLVLGLNLLAFVLYGEDKRRAVRGAWRIPESSLLLAALCGGSVGALLGMYLFRHKTHKAKFRFGVPVILILQAVLLLFLWHHIFS